jgi:uncharacterized damage-inducible protein DinB
MNRFRVWGSTRIAASSGSARRLRGGAPRLIFFRSFFAFPPSETDLMNKKTLLASLTLALGSPVLASGQTVTSSLLGLFEMTKDNVVASAELLDEELYAYRPTDEVRSMGELFAHIADAQYLFCAAAAGESSPATESFEETRKTKAAILEALEMGFGYCEGVYSRMTDDSGGRVVDFFTGPTTAFGVLAFNTAHNYEHYGNLVTYMRLNGIVPPSSRE